MLLHSIHDPWVITSPPRAFTHLTYFHQYPLCSDGFSYHQIYLRHLNWAPDPPQAEMHGASALRYLISLADQLVAPGQHSLAHGWALRGGNKR